MGDIDIEHLERLAALKLADDEAQAAQADLQRIISMIDDMQTVDTSGVAPMANPLDAHQMLREDLVTEEDQAEKFQKVAARTHDGFYLVPRVVE